MPALLNAEPAIPRVGWRAHMTWLAENFYPGQHITILNPTGGGKSYLVLRGPLSLPAVKHARVLFVDDKEGKDKTTRKFGTPITRYPVSRRERPKDRNAPEHYRLIVPDWEWEPNGSGKGTERAQNVVGSAINAFYREAEDPSDEESSKHARASILVIDETFALTDTKPPSLDLAPLVKRGLRKSRFKGQSLICLSQAPLGLPSDVYTQPTHLYIGQMLDQRYRERLREIGGNSKAIQECVATLGQYEFLFLGNKGQVMRVVKVGS